LFKQISYNITWNFLKYAWKNTLLKINITKRYIDFTDNWEWVKIKDIPFLTDKFYQWNKWKTWNIRERWMWVWLSIVKKIIVSHGWNISIKSDKWNWFSFKIYI
jgi:signal transduction histidine kinase